MTSHKQPALLTVEAAAEALCLSQNTVRRLLITGELPGAKIGRQWRVPKNVVDQILAKMGVESCVD